MHTSHYFDNMAPTANYPASVAGANYPAPVAGVADYGHCGYPYAAPVGGAYAGNGTFVLVVVLFILLIIIGCSCGSW